MHIGGRLQGYLDLARPGNAVAAGVLTFTGAFVAGGALARPLAVLAAVLTTVLATAGGNAINDYFDRDVDRINRPDRPIPRGAVGAREALAYSGVLFIAAAGLAVTLPLLALAIAAVNLLALLAYTELFKGTPGAGNLVVAYLTGSTFLFGGAAVGRPLGAAVLFVLAAVATLAREIVKDVEDVAGDRTEGLRTLPIVVGERRALWLAAGVMAVAVAASAVPYLRGTFGLAYVALVVPADAFMLHATRLSFSNAGVGQRRLKQGMLIAAAAFVTGRLAAIAGVGP